MYTPDQLKELIEKSLASIKLPNYPAELYSPISYSLSVGGKRIRPLLCLMTANLFTDRLDDKKMMPAIGLEIFHGFTLVHDDIMDNSYVRRNQPTVYKKWGQNVAILSGDVMFIESYKYISQCDTVYLPDLIREFNSAAIKVCEGQQLDMLYEHKSLITEDDYLKMIELKTGCLMAVSARLGALTAGASIADQDRMYTLGKNLGLAFQIQDDILDTYADFESFGKKIGNDIVANKKTFLLATALRLATNHLLTELKNLVKNNEMDPEEKYNKVRAIYDELDVKRLAEEKTKLFYKAALHELDTLNIAKDRKVALQDFIGLLAERKF